jgi:adenine phosphoribosyltransferase
VSTVDFKSHVREVPDFPTPGIGFKDITPLLLDPDALRA